MPDAVEARALEIIDEKVEEALPLATFAHFPQRAVEHCHRSIHGSSPSSSFVESSIIEKPFVED